MAGRYKDFLTDTTYLEKDKRGAPVDRRVKVIVVALLWEMANIDHSIDQEEYDKIIRSMEHEFHLIDEDVGELIQIADFLTREHKHVEQFIDEVKVVYSPEQRKYLYDLLWEVARVDGVVDQKEGEFAAFLKKKLEV